MTDIDQYDQFADFYEFWISLSPGRVHDGEYYLRWAQEVGAVRAVELGVGSGRVALELARAGIEIVGVDGSPAMLAKASMAFKEAGLGARVSLIEADFAAWSSPSSERFVYAAYGTLPHLTTRDRQLELFRSVAGYLERPEGRFGFDLQVHDPEHLAAIDGTRVRQGSMSLKRSEIQVDRLTEVAWERGTKRITTFADVVSRGRTVRSQEWSFDLAMLSEDDIEDLAAAVGLRVVARDSRPPHAPDHEFWLLGPVP
jgi:SAM-dependent methyltransferase